MAMQGSEHNENEAFVPAPSQTSERLIGALWALTGLLWLAVGYLALHLRPPVPPIYNFALTLASVSTVVVALVTLFCGSRRVYGAALDRLAEQVETMRVQQRERDEAWRTVNALLEPSGSNLRVLPRANGDRN